MLGVWQKTRGELKSAAGLLSDETREGKKEGVSRLHRGAGVCLEESLLPTAETGGRKRASLWLHRETQDLAGPVFLFAADC